MLEYILSLAGALDESFKRRLLMATTEIFTGKHGTFLIQSTSEDSDFILAVEQYESIMDELANLKEKARPGVKKALNGFESCSIEDELDFYEKQLADITGCRRALINQITEISNYLTNPASNQNARIDKEIKNLETIRKMLNSIDKEAIPKLMAVIRGLEKEEKKPVIQTQTRRTRSSNYKDKRYASRVKKMLRPTW